MLENYKGKYVKILVSTNSGAGISGGEASRIYNSMVTVFGTIKDFDKQFIELENSTTLYFSGVNSSYESAFFGDVKAPFYNIKQPAAFENKFTLLNLAHIIEISVVE